MTDTDYLRAIGSERDEEGEVLEEVPEPALDPDVLMALEEQLHELEGDHPSLACGSNGA